MLYAVLAHLMAFLTSSIYFLAQRYKLFSNSPNLHSKMVEGIFLNIQPYRRKCKKTGFTFTRNLLTYCAVSVNPIFVWLASKGNQKPDRDIPTPVALFVYSTNDSSQPSSVQKGMIEL